MQNLGPAGFTHKNVFTFLRGPNKPRDDKGFYVFEGSQTWVPRDLPTKMFLHFCGTQTSHGMTKDFMFLKEAKPWVRGLKHGTIKEK